MVRSRRSISQPDLVYSRIGTPRGDIDASDAKSVLAGIPIYPSLEPVGRVKRMVGFGFELDLHGPGCILDKGQTRGGVALDHGVWLRIVGARDGKFHTEALDGDTIILGPLWGERVTGWSRARLTRNSFRLRDIGLLNGLSLPGEESRAIHFDL